MTYTYEIKTLETLSKTSKCSKWNDEEKEIIQSYLIKYPNVSPKRIVYDLEKNEDIHISENSLRKFRV